MSAAINTISTLIACVLAVCVFIMMFNGKFFAAALVLLLIGVNCKIQSDQYKRNELEVALRTLDRVRAEIQGKAK